MALYQNSVFSDFTIILLQQNSFRTIDLFLLAFSAAAFCWYAQNVARPCSCGDQVVTDRQTDRHTNTHGKTTITLHLCAPVNKITDLKYGTLRGYT